MSSSHSIIGSRTMTGDFDKLVMLGDVDLSDGCGGYLLLTGRADIKNMTVDKIKYVGEIVAERLKVLNLSGAGRLEFRSMCVANAISFGGLLVANNAECRLLRLTSSGKHVKVRTGNDNDKKNFLARIEGRVFGETFEINAAMYLDFDFKYTNIITSEHTVSESEIECERFYGLGVLDIAELNAEQIFIQTYPNTKIKRLMGTKITVSPTFTRSGEFDALPKQGRYASRSVKRGIAQIGTIEGDTIVLENVKADSVSGVDVSIGANCRIKRCEYSGNIQIAEDAMILEVVKI